MKYLFLIGSLALPAVARSQEADLAKVKELVRNEVFAEMLERGATPRSVERAGHLVDSVVVTADSTIIRGVRILRLYPANFSDWHDYLVAYFGGRYFRLGGFRETDALALSRALPARGEPISVEDAHFWYRLLDPYGAFRLFLKGQSLGATDAVLSHAIAQLQSRGWALPDTVTRARVGNITYFRVAGLSLVPSAVPYWIPVVTVLAIDDSGAVVAWRQMIGEAIDAQRR